MKIEFITNASFLVTLNNGKTLLTDPWFDGPCYYGSWYNFPPVEQKERYFNCKPDYIYISHIHPDHFHPQTLKHFPLDTQIIIARFPHNHLKSQIAACGFKNIQEFDVKKYHPFEKGRIVFFPEFSTSSFDVDDGIHYALDTSFLLFDEDGTSLLNVNDNPIQTKDATDLRDKYGSPTISILPTSGASLYPHAFVDYSEAEKEKKCRELTKRMPAKFVSVANELQSKCVIPAAGAYVMGGSIWHYSKYLHQPTPAELKTACRNAKVDFKLIQMFEGDQFSSEDSSLKLNNKCKWRDFSSVDRLSYAEGLKNDSLPHEKIEIPDDFTTNWIRAIVKARHNLWTMQEKLNNYPEWDVRIELTGNTPHVFEFPYTKNLIYRPEDKRLNKKSVNYKIDTNLMKMVLLQSAHWNNVEGAALVEISRKPDDYELSIHNLMSFFHL